MALSITPLDGTRLDTILSKQTQATGTADADLTGTSGVLRAMIVTNAGNEPAHVKVYNGVTAVAATAPFLAFRLSASGGAKRTITLRTGTSVAGYPFTVGLTHRVTDAPVNSAGDGSTVAAGDVEVICVFS